jgi:outer membrane protein OmpA-like peptidoglycan-associated protein
MQWTSTSFTADSTRRAAARAARTALFFEADGVPASSLAVVGHGASDPVAAGGSGKNRRVIVVIEVPGRA